MAAEGRGTRVRRTNRLLGSLYSLADALSVPAVGRVPRLGETLVRTERLRQVGVETATLGQAGQEVVQLCGQAVLRPEAWTCRHEQKTKKAVTSHVGSDLSIARSRVAHTPLKQITL